MDTMEVKNYKNLVSLDDKYVNNMLHIGFVELPNRREPALCSKEFAKEWDALDKKQCMQVEEKLKYLHVLSKQTKVIQPLESIGYQYDCIYYRDMCAIYGNYTLETDENKIVKMKEKVKGYLEKAKENWALLSIIAPYDPNRKTNSMTQILKNDLDDLEKLF